MRAGIQRIDVLDLDVDALIYSTNVMLNCSGGVGACLVNRYGREVQEDLYRLLHDRGSKHAERGEVIQHVSAGLPYSRVFHTLPCNGFYETSFEIISDILHRCLRECVSSPDVRSIALSALATGYGHLKYEEFFPIAASVIADPEFASLESITIGIYDEYSFELACRVIKSQGLPLEIDPSSLEV